jgi:hypothetical protein
LRRPRRCVRKECSRSTSSTSATADELAGEETCGRVGDDWAVVVKLSHPDERLYLREITSFVRNEDGSWRRGDERHENVLVQTSGIPAFLATHGLDVRVAESFGEERLPRGLVAIVGNRLS